MRRRRSTDAAHVSFPFSGVNMYAMLTGKLPYTAEPFHITTLYNKMKNNDMNPIPEHLSPCKFASSVNQLAIYHPCQDPDSSHPLIWGISGGGMGYIRGRGYSRRRREEGYHFTLRTPNSYLSKVSPSQSMLPEKLAGYPFSRDNLTHYGQF